jgi:hypothetical protein
VYPNNSVPEYDVELVQDINNNSVTGSVEAFTVTSSSSSSISISMNYTWNLNGAEKFVRASNRMSIISVHAMSPTQLYYKPFRTVFEVSLTDLSLTTYSQTGLTFTLIPSDLGLSAFTEGTYNFEVRFIGHTSIYPICLTVPVTFTPVPTPTPTPTPGPNCYEYSVSNIGGSTRSVTYTTCEGVTNTINVPSGGSVTLGCVREGTIFGNVVIIQGDVCGLTPTATPTSTPTSTPVGPTPTPTSTPTPTATPTATPLGACVQCTVTEVFSNTNIQYTTCSGEPATTFLSAGTTNYNLGCIIENSASGSASFSYGSVCGGPTPTPTATPVPQPNECYSYTYGPAQAGCTINWTNCDGSAGSTFVASGGFHSITCARPGTLTGCGQFTIGTLCGTFVSPTPTPGPTSTPVPPTATPTSTPVPPGPTPTSTPVPPTPTPVPPTPTPVPPTPTPSITYEQLFNRWQDPCGVPYNNLYIGSDGLYYVFITSYELFNGDTYQDPVPSQDVFNWYDWTTKSYVNGVQQNEFITISPCTNT